MPVTITHHINAPDYGQAERIRLQQHTFITLLWANTRTQDVFARLVQATALSPHIRRLRAALKRQASLDYIKATDAALFEAIIAQRKTIGSTLSDYVEALFGRAVPWVTKELIAHFLTQVQALACGARRMDRTTGMTASAPPRLEITVPVGTTTRELRASLRRSTKAKIHALTTHRGRAPKGQGATSLARDAMWYFLHLVEKQSLRSLAAQYKILPRQNPLSSYDGRALIQRAVRETARRLDLPATRP